LDLLRSPSLFSQDRCFDIVDVPYFKGKYNDPSLKALKNYLEKSIDPEIRIIFTPGIKIDKKSSLYKTVKKIGVIIEYPEFDIYKAGQINRDGMYPYISSYLSASDKRIDADAFKELRLRKENDLYSVIQELDKLIAFSSTKQKIVLDDVKNVVPIARSDQIFQLTDAIMSQNMPAASALIEELIARGTPATHIVQLMARQCRTLIQSCQLTLRSSEYRAGRGIQYAQFRDRVLPEWKQSFSEEIESGLFPILNNHPYVIFKNVISCGRFSELQLQQGLLILKEMDKRVKSTGGLPDYLLREMIFFWNEI